MITSFIHKGLKKFYETGITSGILVTHQNKLRLILTNLDMASRPEDMDLGGLHLHKLRGIRKDIWSVRVSRNWRVTFRFKGSNVEIVNYEDYH